MIKLLQQVLYNVLNRGQHTRCLASDVVLHNLGPAIVVELAGCEQVLCELLSGAQQGLACRLVRRVAAEHTATHTHTHTHTHTPEGCWSG